METSALLCLSLASKHFLISPQRVFLSKLTLLPPISGVHATCARGWHLLFCILTPGFNNKPFSVVSRWPPLTGYECLLPCLVAYEISLVASVADP